MEKKSKKIINFCLKKTNVEIKKIHFEIMDLTKNSVSFYGCPDNSKFVKK